MGRWTAEQANAWYGKMPWLVGCNYTPRSAGNALEFWQAETFNPAEIDQELAWAKGLGFNSLRVFLHDLVWAADPQAYLARIDRFLGIAARHGIGAMIVFFDSCWHPFPHAGKQPEPEPGLHNSIWVQSPGVAVLREPERFAALEAYVRGVMGHFRNDPRVQVWDLWNEPDGCNANSYGPRDMGEAKAKVVLPLLEKVFAWARAAEVSQPLTSGVWAGGWGSDAELSPMSQLQLTHSDIVSYHCYGKPEEMHKRLEQLRRLGRPMVCTEYMARGVGSTFEAILPILKDARVGAYNWGFVAGRSQTQFAWDSWQKPYPPEPPLWFHDIFRPDGTPYRAEEVAAIRQLTGARNR